eukprot:scaffold144640_cov15-Tisochrysis_lutea.AAC.1
MQANPGRRQRRRRRGARRLSRCTLAYKMMQQWGPCKRWAVHASSNGVGSVAVADCTAYTSVFFSRSSSLRTSDAFKQAMCVAVISLVGPVISCIPHNLTVSSPPPL